MYNLSGILPGWRNPSFDEAFGKVAADAPVTPGVAYLDSYHYNLPLILSHRLLHASNCYTDDPAAADLFWVPLHIQKQSSKVFSSYCKSFRRLLNVTPTGLASQLPHLTASTAHRHFFVVGFSHMALTKSCDGWFSNPRPEFHSFVRVAHTHVLTTNGSDALRAHLYGVESNQLMFKSTRWSFPNLISVPLPGLLHTTPLENGSHHRVNADSKRSQLMIFVGHDVHGDVSVRKRITAQCAQSWSCLWKRPRPPPTELVRPVLAEVILLKRKSVFCLEPAGDAPDRPSISDSVACGCIPVLFNPLTHALWPYHWNNWKAAGTVLVPRAEFLAGKINLEKLLSSIPQPLLERLQQTVNENAQRFIYSVYDDPHDDALQVMLRAVKSASEIMALPGEVRSRSF